MKCFHHNDLDGRCAGAVVNLFREAKAIEECQFIEMEYSKDFPLDLVKSNERVYIVDFHVQDDDDFRKLQEITKNITLIDHHKSTVEHRDKHPELYSDIESIIDSSRSGCWLTWEYFIFSYGNRTVPRALLLIDDMDRWIWKYGDKTANFCEGMKLYPHQPTDTIWQDLLMSEYTSLETKPEKSDDKRLDIIADGKICVQYANMICEDYVSSYGFETEFEGHKAFAQGLYAYGSKAFGERIKQYPLLISFEFTGDKYIIGLYSETIDVSEIAVKHGGGGHKGASGFIANELPFRSIKNE